VDKLNIETTGGKLLQILDVARLVNELTVPGKVI
jgi:hypothetical protein